MKRSEVYSWRVATELKAALEHEARRERASVGGLLERIALEWLSTRRAGTDGDEAQARLHAAAAKTFGSLAGGDPHRSTAVRAAVRRRLAARRGR
jgi:hypothetical protein